ncbi:MAG: hypothetical protein ACREJC_22990 [Tepidisphaeraceae bacterium]
MSKHYQDSVLEFKRDPKLGDIRGIVVQPWSGLEASYGDGGVNCGTMHP